MASTAAEFALFLEPKLSNIWHDAFAPEADVYSKVMNVRDMGKNTITDAKLAGFGNLQPQPDGDQMIYDDPISPITKSYTYSVRGLGYKIHERLWMNDLYGEVERFESDLKDSSKDDVETSGASVFNNAFTTTNTGFDGLALCSTSHPRMDSSGQVQANRPSTDEALSLSALHNAMIMIDKWKNERGRPRSHNAKTLLVPSDLMIVADELLSSELKPGTANNDKNVIRRFGLNYLRWKHLTSTTAYFITCDKHDVNFLWRFRPKSGTETDFDTETVKRKVRQGYTYGFGEWRGIWGTTGA